MQRRRMRVRGSRPRNNRAGALFLLTLAVVSIGCAPLTAKTLGERESGYTYVPIDPFAVRTCPGGSCSCDPEAGELCGREYRTLLESLPDNAVRMLVERFNASGSVTYGAAKVGSAGESYQVTVDYINADTIDLPVYIRKSVRRYKEEPKVRSWWFSWLPAAQEPPIILDERFIVPVTAPSTRLDVPDSEEYSVERATATNCSGDTCSGPATEEQKKADQRRDAQLREEKYEKFDVPLYIGIGLRISAAIDVLGADANIAGIGIIAAEAEANKLRGSLVVQTLGVNGKSVAAALPIQSELNRTTAQNAIVSVGAIKALLYAGDTVVSPRVVGLYLPFPGGKALVNRIISAISNDRVVWKRPCVQKDTRDAKTAATAPTSAAPTDTSLPN